MDINLEEITHHASWVMLIFLIGYTAIVIEEFIKFNKAATALLMAIICWTILFLEPAESLDRHLYIFSFQMFKVAQVIFFLMGALTIVEIINVHKAFGIITQNLLIPSKKRMVWVIGLVTFFLSSVLDNLTTTIVMVSLLTKIVENRDERLLLDGVIIIAANAGGAWTPIGDVSTTLLWINERVTAFGIIRDTFAPSILGLIASLLWFSSKFNGTFAKTNIKIESSEPGGTLVLTLGLASLIFVPIFKMWTGLPAFMGMMFGLGIMWVVTDLMHYRYSERNHLRVIAILPKIDISIILFYLGVLLSINSLESAGILTQMAHWLDQKLPSTMFIPILVGLVSSIIDNVSLVAATIAMYDLKAFATDSAFWQAITYCAGTGGSILIIGSAAGVAVMAMERVSFLWYLRKVTLPALTTYFVGVVAYFLLSPITKMI